MHRLAVGIVCALIMSSRPACASSSMGGDAIEHLSGRVRLNEGPVVAAEVTLFKSGAARGQGAVPIATAITDEDGEFDVIYRSLPDDGSILYLMADRGHQRVATVLGMGDLPEHVSLNELTTVATAYVMNQFLAGEIIGGNIVGVRNAASTFRNLIRPGTGDAAESISSFPNGESTDALRKFNTLGNILAFAASSPRDFSKVSLLASPPCGAAPEDLLGLAASLARYPDTSPQALFDLSTRNPIYQPALSSATDATEDGVPITWTLMLRYGGDPSFQMNGPGRIAVDGEGTIWIINNFDYAANPDTPVCTGTYVTRLAPNGELYGSSPYSGGGLGGAGWGLAFDTRDHVWVGNFGFEGAGATDCTPPARNSVSKFTSDGVPLSPGAGGNPECDPDQGGFCNGEIVTPQGVVSDSVNTIWVANLCVETLTKIPDGDPLQAYSFPLVAEGGAGDPAPFGIAIDGGDRAWVTDNGASVVYRVEPDDSYQQVRASTAIDFKRPMGNAVDSNGNAWIADSGIIPISEGGNCDGLPPMSFGEESRYGPLVPDEEFAGIMRVTPDGRIVDRYSGGGLSVPWGVAVDGDDHVWIADFNGGRVSKFCGANEANWPCGLSVGDPISPPDGYRSDALARNVCVAIDQSGNVWLSNNFLIDCFGERDANPGGKTVVQFLGVAAPVEAPVVGVPRRPGADPASFCPADFNGDGAVDGADLGRLLGAWGSNDGWYELSGDAAIGGADLGLLLQAWGACE